jgi:hypothetical protein
MRPKAGTVSPRMPEQQRGAIYMSYEVTQVNVISRENGLQMRHRPCLEPFERNEFCNDL